MILDWTIIFNEVKLFKRLVMKTLIKLTTLLLLIVINYTLFAQGVLIPADLQQQDFLKTYKLVLAASNEDFRSTSNQMDTKLFPTYSEFSVYWALSGENKGKFVLPHAIPEKYASVASFTYSDYQWNVAEHASIQFKKSPDQVAIFNSSIKDNNSSVTWEAFYFKNIFDSYLYDDIYYFVDETHLADSGLHATTKLLIIPAFVTYNNDNTFYINQIIESNPQIKQQLDVFLSKGGTIYAEGNATYFIEKLGYLESGAIKFDKLIESDPETGLVDLQIENETHPIALAGLANANTIFSNGLPDVKSSSVSVIAKLPNTPVIFEISGNQAAGGRIVCNTALPAVGGVKDLLDGSRQLQWILNTVLYAFSHPVDVTRAVYNTLPPGITAGRNAVPYDKIDTFEIHIKLRNLSAKAVSELSVKENVQPFFRFVGIDDKTLSVANSENTLEITNIDLPPFTEKEIIYRVQTVSTNDTIRKHIDELLVQGTLMPVSIADVSYKCEATQSFVKQTDYADIMFSAKIAADTDLNWKNFLSLEYQPFKVFMIMENKERTPAVEASYTQYIPKDVPFYWSDNSINIPILKTPGGKFIDVLRGSNDQDNPEFDMDSDGKPDVWLDTASIYPKGYTLVEEEVYWLNPWNHLRSEDKTTYYEDIDHDGQFAQDTNDDGIVDVEEQGDKIRVWKVTWNIGEIPGYMAYEPFCSYEMWVDPPDLVKLSAGVSYVHGKLEKPVEGMFYPYSKGDLLQQSIENLKADTTWTHWMERDSLDNIVWNQLIFQKINNYEGFTFIDTLNTNYSLLPTDTCFGTVPQPHREFIAVLSLGGEEIDMKHPTPSKSLYSNLNYKTIFNEDCVTPIRTTYTYYAPLPNPLQFEYLTNQYQASDKETGEHIITLPNHGFANLTFEMDASTEYSYYWIRNVGTDVDYNDPSSEIDKIEAYGDGVFGYLIYDLPKGLGGYRIHLPQKADGSYDIDALVEIDGKPFSRWLDNENTGDSVEVWEDDFQYHIYIPQVLIPPALDDDNEDDVDDWIDDRGDRFRSPTGFLHDAFMPDDGEKWKDYPKTSFKDDIYGMVDSGWYAGADGAYGDDFVEELGRTHIKINAIYEGLGREGPIELSKGGWLVVEEIFGGSPWVIFSHTLSGFAQGVDYEIVSKPNPSVLNFGLDTGYVKHAVRDTLEPHVFDGKFDPYHVSWGFDETTLTTYAGGKDPCSLIYPSINMSTIISPKNAYTSITLLPNAKGAISGYPKQVEGTFLEVRIEVVNGSDGDWRNVIVKPELPPDLLGTELAFSYVAYPRPLVPGDDFGTFAAGWRFNEPEGEVLVKLGDTLPLLQPGRRANFLFLFKIDETLQKGIYQIPFAMNATKYKRDKVTGTVSQSAPPAMFSITERDASGWATEFQNIVIGSASLKNIETQTTPFFEPTGRVRWSLQDVNHSDFEKITQNLSATFDPASRLETIDLSGFNPFPTAENYEFFILEEGVVSSYTSAEDLVLMKKAQLNYTYEGHDSSTSSKPVKVVPIGPKILIDKAIVKVNGKEYHWGDTIFDKETLNVKVQLIIKNAGNDIAQNVTLLSALSPYYEPIIDSLPINAEYLNQYLNFKLGTFTPGQTKEYNVHFLLKTDLLKLLGSNTKPSLKSGDAGLVDLLNPIHNIDVTYKGTAIPETFSYADERDAEYKLNEIHLTSFNCDKTDIARNEQVTLTASAENLALDAQKIWFRMFATSGDKTIKFGERYYADVKRGDEMEIEVKYTIPDTASSDYKFFVVADQTNSLNEILETNNSDTLKAKFVAPLLTANITLQSINNIDVTTSTQAQFSPLDSLIVKTTLNLSNLGNDKATNNILRITPAPNFVPILDKLP